VAACPGDLNEANRYISFGHLESDMAGYRLNAGELAHHRWALATVFSTNGQLKLEFAETVAGFVVTEVPQGSSALAAAHQFKLEDHLAANGIRKGVLAATHPAALMARKQSYLAAASFYQSLVGQHGIRYPSPTRGLLREGKWQAELKSQLRGSPFLALALADDQSGGWVTVQQGTIWQTLSDSTLVGADQFARQLRSYGRLTVQLRQEADQLVITRLDSAGSTCESLSNLPSNLRDKAFNSNLR
jgi:hypothetical protein